MANHSLASKAILVCGAASGAALSIDGGFTAGDP
jgi:hypothetical protein